MIVKTFGAELTIHRLTTSSDREHWQAGFVEAYQNVFEGAPYFERTTTDAVEGQYRKLTGTPGNITLVAVTPAQKVVGFSSAVPVRAISSVARELSGLVPLAHTMYLAELGVLPQYRGNSLGKELILQRLRLTDPKQFTHMVLRVSASRNLSADLYQSLGFEDMGVYMDVTALRVDGEVKADRRFFMSKVLSQVQLG